MASKRGEGGHAVISALTVCCEVFGILADTLPGAAAGPEPARGARLVLDALDDLQPTLRVLRRSARRR